MNPVKASTRDTHEVTHLGKEEVFTAAKVAPAIIGIKSGKAAGEDEIRPEMLKALTIKRRNSLVNASMSSCVEAWQNSQRLASRCYSDIQKKEITSNVRTTEEYHSLVCQEKYMPNALKGNAEK